MLLLFTPAAYSALADATSLLTGRGLTPREAACALARRTSEKRRAHRANERARRRPLSPLCAPLQNLNPGRCSATSRAVDHWPAITQTGGGRPHKPTATKNMAEANGGVTAFDVVEVPNVVKLMASEAKT